MEPPINKNQETAPQGSGLIGLLKPYAPLIWALIALTILGNGLNLLVPRIISQAIDSFTRQQLVLATVAARFFVVSVGIFVFAYLQSVVQTYASERVARDLRTRLVTKISTQDHACCT